MKRSKEFEKLLEYCEENGIVVRFVDSRTLKDYAGENPAAAKVMGFHNIKSNEIEIDRTMPEETQCRNLKHELVELRLMNGGMEYWQAHVKALEAEKHPFDFSTPMNIHEANVIPVEEHHWGHEEHEESERRKPKPKKKRRSLLARFGILKSK